MQKRSCGSKFNDYQLVADLSDGLKQSKCCQYFYGTSDLVEFGDGKCGVALLHNPKDSNKVVYLNKISCANYSSSPLRIEVYARAELDGKMKCSDGIKPGNSKCLYDVCPQAEILYSSKVTTINGDPVYLRSIMPFDTSDGFPRGSIILYPGFSRIYLFKSLEPNEKSLGSMSFGWWEEPIC